MEYEKLIQGAVERLRQGDQEITEIQLEGMLSGLAIAMLADSSLHFEIEDVRRDILRVILESLPPITKEDLEEILVYFGESLADLGATYEEELFAFFREKHPKACEQWLQEKQRELEEERAGSIARRRKRGLPELAPEALIPEEPSHDGLLHAMSSSGDLDAAVIVEFAQVNLAARRHLLELKDKLHSRK